MREDRRAQQMARLEAARKRTNERLAAQHRRVDARFERIRQRMLAREDNPSTDQQRIITAALELLDETGLNDLSLRKLAAKLDLQAPALYWHFKNKEELIDYMAEAILAQAFTGLTPRAPDESWQEWLIALCKQLRHAMLSRRDGARIVAGAHFSPAVTLVNLFETAIQSLVSAGVDTERAQLIITTAVHFTFGRVIEEQSGPSEEEIKRVNFEQIKAEFPHLAQTIERIHRAGSLVKLRDQEFDESLRLIIR